MTLSQSLQMFMANKEVPLAEIYPAFPQHKPTTIRGRINEAIDKYFKRVGNGVYTSILGKYQIVYADPAWTYNNKGRGAAENHYDCMALEEIKSLPVADLCKKDAVLFLWATWPLLPEALKVMEAWGFEYKTCAFVLVKLNKDGTPFLGMGHYTRGNTEPCLLGIRRKGMKVKKHNISQVVQSIREVHSRKPSVIYKHIEELHGHAERLELFARERRENWSQWGYGVPSTIQRVIDVKNL